MGRGKAIAIVGGAVVAAWAAAEIYSMLAGVLGPLAPWFAAFVFLGGLGAVLEARSEG